MSFWVSQSAGGVFGCALVLRKEGRKKRLKEKYLSSTYEGEKNLTNKIFGCVFVNLNYSIERARRERRKKNHIHEQ